MKLSEIHIEFIKDSIFDCLPKKSNDTKRSILKYIRQVFELQIQRGSKTLSTNPTAGISLPRTQKQTLKTMSIEEVQKLVEHSEQTYSAWDKNGWA